MMKFTSTILLFLWSFTAYSQPMPQAGTVNITGEVTIPPNIRKDSVWLHVTIPHPFTGENKTYKTLLDRNGRFAVQVNTSTDQGICAVRTDVNMEHSLTVPLKNGRESKIAFTYDNDGHIDKATVSNNPGFTEEDLALSLIKYDELLGYRSNRPPVRLYDKPFSAFVDHTHHALQERKTVLNKPPFLSEKMNEIVFRDYTLVMYYSRVFDYHNSMVLNYRNMNDRKMPDSSEIITPVRQDYSFLKNLDLNNPQYLYCYAYPAFMQELLQNSTLHIPRIQDTPIAEWVQHVKKMLSPLVGFDRGLFYDALTSNAYAMQFEAELKPLTAKQTGNIKSYYKGGEVEKILLRKNAEIIEDVRSKEALVVHAAPDVSPEKLMSAIVARHKGKAVVVDFWATWCVPCLQAFKTSRDLKKQLAGKDVVFVYISSNPTSPKALWERLIQGIGGQQYYLSKDEWQHLQNQFDFSGIPTYLIFDKKGALKQKFTGYPGNEEMLRRIEGAL